MINLQEVTLTRGNKCLLEKVNYIFYDKQHIGLIGKNGSGKSSLFALLLHKLEPSAGDVNHQDNLKIAHVEQEISSLENKAIDYVIQADKEYILLRNAINQAENLGKYEQLASLHEQFTIIDGYTIASRAAVLLAGLGFNETMQNQTVKSFSGGWRMRLNLARALLCHSDALLLDEPTNHLDLEAILWLEKWLQNYRGLLVIISHDRDFLDKTVDYIVHLDDRNLKLYRGNYSSFEAEQAKQIALQQAIYEKQQRHISHMMQFVERFRYKASKAKQAQSRLKAINKIQQVAALQTTTPFNFEFKVAEKCPYPILSFDHVTLSYGNNIILKNINWQLIPGDRIALLGPNGAGKSTLIKALAGKLAPQAGKIIIDRHVNIGYFAQHQVEALELNQSPLNHFSKIAPNITQQQLRSYLGGFGFSGDSVLSPMMNFSGGEKARIALALLVWQKPNLLLLDEPTNHFDMEMRNAITLALQSFQGAFILVSHDRFLIRNTVDQLALINKGQIQSFDGDLDDYRKSLTKQNSSQQNNSGYNNKIKTRKINRKSINPLKVAKLEKKIQAIQIQLNQIIHELSTSDIYLPKNKAKRLLLFAEQQQLQQQINALEEEWLSYQE